ncbi:MAG: glycosyltransferase [Muribaculaceae bacterium]|nr:glycosyltransferase [Muribaculaceae bacterium]
MSQLISTDQKPLVSVITVTFNAANAIATTMESVRSQSAVNFEHIIMDGASTDNTLDIVRNLASSRTVVFSSPDNGIYDAMNKALDVAKGQYVLFLNAGDSFANNLSLQRYIDAIHDNNFPGVIYGQTIIVDKQNNILGERHLKAPEHLTLRSFGDGMVVCHQAFMALKKIAPLYDLRYRFSADYEWCIRCLQHSRSNIYLGQEPVIHYLSEGLTTRNHKQSLKERFNIMCVYFGTFTTIFRHLKFALRYAKRRHNSINVQ